MKACLIFTVNLLCDNGQNILDTQCIEFELQKCGILKDIVKRKAKVTYIICIPPPTKKDHWSTLLFNYYYYICSI